MQILICRKVYIRTLLGPNSSVFVFGQIIGKKNPDNE